MPSQTVGFFEIAISNRHQIVCDYLGYSREVCPHVLGYGVKGNEQAIVFQFGGQSSNIFSSEDEWRCFDLRLVRNVVLRPGPWHTGEKNMAETACVNRIYASVF